MQFWLGVHEPSWLPKLQVPMMVSRRRLERLKKLPQAIEPWVLDSGGFSELSMFGEWRTTESTYINYVQRCMDEIGNLEWAAPQDWMCEPMILEKTKLSVTQHQQKTVDNYLSLRTTAEHLPFIPVLQGWVLDDYLRCADLYDKAGIDLTQEPITGLGSVCRRQSATEIEDIVLKISKLGISCHGFGVKTQGFKSYGHLLASADSMAWSLNARKRPPLPGCHHGKDGLGSCGECSIWALRWRERLLSGNQNHQLHLGLG